MRKQGKRKAHFILTDVLKKNGIIFNSAKKILKLAVIGSFENILYLSVKNCVARLGKFKKNK